MISSQCTILGACKTAYRLQLAQVACRLMPTQSLEQIQSLYFLPAPTAFLENTVYKPNDTRLVSEHFPSFNQSMHLHSQYPCPTIFSTIDTGKPPKTRRRSLHLLRRRRRRQFPLHLHLHLSVSPLPLSLPLPLTELLLIFAQAPLEFFLIKVLVLLVVRVFPGSPRNVNQFFIVATREFLIVGLDVVFQEGIESRLGRLRRAGYELLLVVWMSRMEREGSGARLVLHDCVAVRGWGVLEGGFAEGVAGWLEGRGWMGLGRCDGPGVLMAQNWRWRADGATVAAFRA